MAAFREISSNDGTVISFRQSGAGRPLLLIHGATADHNSWHRVSPQLERHFTVYAVDRRGREGSGDSPDYHFSREVEDVAAVVEAIGEPVFLLGHSYGGLLSLEAALLTDRVNRLILYEADAPDGADPFPPGATERMQALIGRGEWEAAMELFMREIAMLSEPELAAYHQTPLWAARLPLAPTIPRELAIYQTYRFDPARFAHLQTPTMLLLGGDSPPSVRQPVERIDAALPDSRIVILPGQGHIAHHTDPDLFVREVLQFLLYE